MDLFTQERLARRNDPSLNDGMSPLSSDGVVANQNGWNSAVAASGQWRPDYVQPIDLGAIQGNRMKTASELVQGFVPWKQFGQTMDPTMPLMAPDKAIASLQKDPRFASLGDEMQELVLRIRGGEDAIRQYKTMQALSLLNTKNTIERQGQLQKEADDLRLTPIKRIKSMLMEGTIRANPNGGLEVFDETAPGSGIKGWKQPDSFTLQHAEQAWPAIFGQAVPLNKDQQKALGILRENPKASIEEIKARMNGHVPVESIKPKLDIGSQAGANAYNQEVANLQNLPPGSKEAAMAKRALARFFTQPMQGDERTPLEMGAEETSAFTLSALANIITHMMNASRMGANAINQFAPWQTQPYEMRPTTNPDEVKEYFNQAASEISPIEKLAGMK